MLKEIVHADNQDLLSIKLVTVSLQKPQSMILVQEPRNVKSVKSMEIKSFAKSVMKVVSYAIFASMTKEKTAVSLAQAEPVVLPTLLIEKVRVVFHSLEKMNQLKFLLNQELPKIQLWFQRQLQLSFAMN